MRDYSLSMTNMGQWIIQQKLKPNQSVPALIPLDRPKMYWPLVIQLITLLAMFIN